MTCCIVCIEIDSVLCRDIEIDLILVLVWRSKLTCFLYEVQIDFVFVCGSKITCVRYRSMLSCFIARGSKLTCFLFAGLKLLVFCVGIDSLLFCVVGGRKEPRILMRAENHFVLV